MSRRKKLILTVSVLFIGINSLLVYFDDKDRVSRLTYVRDWAETVEKDMYETIETTAVLATAEEKNVYFAQEKGSFQEFLVKEGADVETGDPLFTYRVDSYFEIMADLESKQQKLNGEIQAIESAIASISAYRIPQTDTDTEFDNEAGTLEMTRKSVDANYMKEQYLAEKEKELAQKEAELKSVQAQISELETNGETITVESPYQGKVRAISDSLDNPVVTIWGKQLQAEGELTETERMAVEQKMPVKVDIRENEAVLTGTLDAISDSPENINIRGSSQYAFEAGLKDESDQPAENDQSAQSESAPQAEESEGQTDPAPEEETEENGHQEGARETDGAVSIKEAADSNQTSESPESGGGATPPDTESVEQAKEEKSRMDHLLPGYHADVTIITDESKKATVVKRKQLFNSHLWKMTSEGLLIKQQVETGIHMDDLVEMTEGTAPGEWVAEADNSQFRDGAVFITPLKLDDIEWQDLSKYDNVNWKRYMIIGLLSR
ncbi:hypothetical protein GCM10007063_21090 [Lentibacillus kapialis]|uniref:YknX-like barrel-sandwich hybrid domain-containing protein n=1 Tax=Lentibacillus kapialis TaxID=340214 RepID=A0A917UYX6_9BACI|nr:efflux RND transporter periplasmic adaptor subunit [Lentibacillus kapialis]GGJ98576.1 hypothetical protein GCM10007063_21090 [Lentibacillus kapialis]